MDDTNFSPHDLGISEQDWQQTPPAVRVIVRSTAILQARVAELEEQLKLSSSTSSNPPSSDQPRHQRPREGKMPSGRKRGGQAGHKGHHRQVRPADEVSEFRVYKPDTCRHCGDGLCGDDPNPYRWQVTEIPPLQPIITEHQVHRLSCASCGQTTGGSLPSAVACSQFGERLSALVNLLIGQYRLSKRQVAGVLRDVFGVSMAASSVVKRQTEMAESLQAAYDDVAQQIKTASRRNIDETGWRETAQRSQLWGVVSETATLFRIVASRAGAIAADLLGADSTGITTSDRWTAYNFLRGERHQTCWAHLLRHFKRLELRDQESAEVGAWLVMHSQYLLHRWRQVREGKLARSDFDAEARQHRHDIERWLERGTLVKHEKTAELCRGLLRHFEMLWTFTRHTGIEPTNNEAERALRHGVIWRKLCYGTDAASGSRFAERILTVLATCRQQERDLLRFLHDSLTAHRHERDAPLLLATT
jgi:transposase